MPQGFNISNVWRSLPSPQSAGDLPQETIDLLYKNHGPLDCEWQVIRLSLNRYLFIDGLETLPEPFNFNSTTFTKFLANDDGTGYLLNEDLTTAAQYWLDPTPKRVG